MSKIRLNPIAEPATPPTDKVDLYIDVADGHLKSKDDAGVVNDHDVDFAYTAENVANKKTDLTDNSDTYYPSQKAVKTAVDAKQNSLGFTAENVANKDTDTALSANSDTKYPSQKAVKAYIDALIAASDAVVYKGATDCSTNPNYPSADAGHLYLVSVAGKIGGASGIVVSAGDMFICKDDGTASGTQAAQGTHWNVIQTNITYVPEDVANKDTDGALTANSDTLYASQKATKTYADAKVSDTAYSDAFNGVTAIAPSKNAIWDANFDALQEDKLMTALGSVMLARTIFSTPIINTYNPGTTICRFNAIYIPRRMTITGVKWMQATQGAYTATDNNRIGLYSYSGGTLTLVASCANDGNLWKATANTIATKAFSSTYDAQPGVYFIGFTYNYSAQTTGPTLGAGVGWGSTSHSLLDFTNSAKLSALVNFVSDLPSSQAMSGLTNQNNNIFFAVY